jgi:D-3-phosphoglycerate dehydrogenase
MTDNRRTVLHLDTFPKAGREVFAGRADVRLLSVPIDITRAQMMALLEREPRMDAMILGVQPVGPAEVAAARQLAVVARVGVGYDAIDVPALTAAKLPLMVTGTANSPSVAEAALYFMLALAKKGPALDAMVKQGRWADRFNDMPGDLFGKTVLVIGFGRIGSRVVKRCLANEMVVLVSDPFVEPAAIRAAGAEPVTDLPAALARADILTLHCPKTPQTTNLIDAAALARLKPTAFLVNTARGGIVDEGALFQALASGKLAGAGLDVLAIEPAKADHPLFQLPNVLTAPHMAGVTAEAFDRMAVQAAENVLSVFDGRINRANVVNVSVLD